MAVPLLLLLSFLCAFAEGDREEGGEALQEGAQRPLHWPQGETPSLLALALAVARRASIPETPHFLDGLPLALFMWGSGGCPDLLCELSMHGSGLDVALI